MTPAQVEPVAERTPALLALAVPVLAGLSYQAAFGAPGPYPIVTAGALALGLGWILFGPTVPRTAIRPLAAALLAVLALPLLTGPEINDVRRWVPLGPVMLHTGMLTIPLLLRIAAAEEADAPILLSVALFAALLQPDAASAAAVTFGTVGLYHVRPDWKLGLVIIIGFFVIIVATLRGELAPRPFVERVLLDALEAGGPALALGLLAALAASFLLVLFGLAQPRAERFALAGTLFGFAIMAMVNTYPMPLIGFGAAPILGYALAAAGRMRPAG